ncbi:TetR/AcrR family transcriptional regulator [Saccharothrix australiensis]|uniref:TetR family transcriptional regulator n=1 Tax=Saccharothrix australiensis TaxID=2072 RepID=A0A495W885_9PSEU|nr:TetR/AcrR family transcriptional regulator [Saccharothrix australiensis]RKT57981.1 TetR family transcriptional regulator [Saccharothrix australiensis]
MTRRQQVLDAAIRVLGTTGPRGLTHRAVDAAAGLPEGSSSNHFRTRDALVAGVVDRLLERETELWGRLADDVSTPDGFATAVGRLVEELARERVLTLARHAVFVEAAVRPDLGRRIADAHRRIAGWAAPLVRALGSTDPPRDFRLLLAVVDGLLTNQLANPQPDFAPGDAVRTVLRGMLGLRPA